MDGQTELDLRTPGNRGKDIFLCHTGIDKPWVERLAGRIEAEPYNNRLLGVVLDKWDFPKGSNIVVNIEKGVDECRFVGIVVTRALLVAPWPTLERSIAVWSDPAGALGRVIPLVRENVTLPGSLRIRNWIDFRNDERFEEAFAELIRLLRGEQVRRGHGSLQPTGSERRLPYEPAPVVITSSIGADRVQERIVSNLFPVVDLPEFVFSSDTKLTDKADIRLYTEDVSPPPFLLRENRLWTFVNLYESDSYGAAVGRSVRRDSFENWFHDPDKARWAVELLNLHLKETAWRRFLRLDKDRHRFFFSPKDGQPKKISWKIGGKWSSRELTSRHMVKRPLPDGSKQRVQSGWRHQACKASFILLPHGLFLNLEPTWMLTKSDGKTPRGGPRVGPILSHWLNQERNGQVLRSVRFWSLVFARGKTELSLPTGQRPIRISLTPACGDVDFGIAGDQTNYDQLMASEMEDDIEVPQLGLYYGDFGEMQDARETEK